MAGIHDIVLIHFEDTPLVFARIEAIQPDHKPDWYHVKLLLLQVPVQVVTWILKDVYIEGAEFTMNGKRMRLEKVEHPKDQRTDDIQKTGAENEKTVSVDDAKIISFKDFKKE